MELSKIYFDTVENEYVLEKKPFAEPNRYFDILENPITDLFVERIQNGEDKLIISYAKEEVDNNLLWTLRRQVEADKYNFNLEGSYIVSFTVPTKEYMKLLESLEKKGDAQNENETTS